ncbi:MAG: transcriptional repressor NrdR [Candidatus Omnitrophica bacterium]|nr:transcriptional repressor NrdR [Candidatus Omnitrophota bacterium]
MKCPFCGHAEDKVVDSRASSGDASIRRRRECLGCGKRFTTYEQIEEQTLMVIKKDGRRERFDRQKLLSGLMKACEKRPVSMEQLERLVDELEREVSQQFDREVSSREIGERVMRRLHVLDPVAYVRFASVYREFKDVEEFMKELKDLLAQKGK